jgi:hypothetical protein
MLWKYSFSFSILQIHIHRLIDGSLLGMEILANTPAHFLSKALVEQVKHETDVHVALPSISSLSNLRMNAAF